MASSSLSHDQRVVGDVIAQEQLLMNNHITYHSLNGFMSTNMTMLPLIKLFLVQC